MLNKVKVKYRKCLSLNLKISELLLPNYQGEKIDKCIKTNKLQFCTNYLPRLSSPWMTRCLMTVARQKKFAKHFFNHVQIVALTI
jgi:hypothetical protein